MRTVTVELVDRAVLDIPYEWNSQEKQARIGRGLFAPLTPREWDRIERRVRKGLPVRRKPIGLNGSPRPRLADGRYVDDVLDARR